MNQELHHPQKGGTKPHYLAYMVKNHEDAYRLKNLSLFTVEYDHYLGQKNKDFGEIWHLWFISMSGEYCKTIFVLLGVPKNCNRSQFSP